MTYGVEHRADKPEDRLVIRAQNPDDHREWNGLLPKSTPLFTWKRPDYGTFVRWTLPREEAEKRGWWGLGCSCCGVGGGDPETGVWEFDTPLGQVIWYLHERQARTNR